ncbi:MAG: lamin tail domain-containing protein [Bacteroidota bacterium]
MKKLLFVFAVAAMTITGCVNDDTYVPPTPEAGDVVLNEIFSKHPDPTVEGDWVELFNAGDIEADISGYLINDAADPAGGFVIPEGTKIAAKGYYVVTQPELTVSISSGGEDVSLGDPEGTLIDLIYCPKSQADGTSFSRIPDGGDVWINGTEATPGATNIGDATTPSISVDYNVAPAAGETIEMVIDFATSETVNEVAVFYATGDAPAYDANNKIVGTIAADSAVVTMTDLNVASEMVSFFVAITLDNSDVYYYGKDNKSAEATTLTADASLWHAYTPIAGSVPAPTLALTYSATPTEGYETITLAYTAEIDIVEARVYFAAGDAPVYIKANKVKGEDVINTPALPGDFTQTGVTISMANLDVEDAAGAVVGNSSDAGVKISFYIRIALSNGFEYYYDKDGNVILDDTSIVTDDAASDAFKADATQWNTYTNKATVTVSSFDFPVNPAATDDINVVLAYASNETILEARIYYAGSEGLYVKPNKIKGEDDASFTQTGVTVNMRDQDVLKADETTLDGTTSTSGATIKFYVRIATATSEYYFTKDGGLMAVDDSPADGAYDSSDAFKGDSSQWSSYTVQ